MEKQSSLNRQDRDLLIRLDQKVDSLQGIVQELKDGTLNRLESLEREKADREEVQQVQQKINDLQKHINENVEVRTRKLEDKTSSYFITQALYTLFIAGLTTLVLFHIFYSK